MGAMQQGLERAGRFRLSGKLAFIAVLVLAGLLWLSGARHKTAKPAMAAPPRRWNCPRPISPP